MKPTDNTPLTANQLRSTQLDDKTQPLPIRRMTQSTSRVLSQMLKSPEPLWGLKISKDTNLPSGTVYPLLDRLESLGWIQGEWQEVGHTPRRRVYVIPQEFREALFNACVEFETRKAKKPIPVRRGATG